MMVSSLKYGHKYINSRTVASFFVILLLCASAALQASAKVYNVRDFGATGNGHTLDTPAVNKAIEAAAEAGGGTVFFPSGTYLCFSIHLKSDVTLYLEQGATIMAADPAKDNGNYDPAEPNKWDHYQDYGHSHWHNSLIWGVGLHDIAIVGQGLINGRGLVRSGADKPGLGDKAIALKLCRNVNIRDISILNGGHFGILATGVDNMTIDNLKIDTNRDGIDIDACRNVRVSNCSVNSPYDDAICPKSSYALGYLRATENLTITNCMVSGYDDGTMLNGTFKTTYADSPKHRSTGRIKLGTESNGGFKNITITNCVFDHCRGLALETVDGGSLEDVTISNITMRNLTSAPLFLRLGSRMRGPSDLKIGKLQRINISNIVVYNANPDLGSIISGIPGHDIKDISLHDIRIIYKGGGSRKDAGIIPPEKASSYPEPEMFGTMPSYGFYIRHVNGLQMHDIYIGYEKPDYRPAFVLNQVDNARFNNIELQKESNVPAFILRNVRNLRYMNVQHVNDQRIQKATDKTL